MGAGRGPTGGREGERKEAGWAGGLETSNRSRSGGMGRGPGRGAKECDSDELGEGARKIPGTNLKRPEKSNKERGLTENQFREERAGGVERR